MAQAQFDTPGAQVWTCPAGVTSVTVECWGPGGDGADGIYIVSPVETRIAGGGGGGGAYARKTISVTPSNNYDLIVGAHGTSTPSSFEADCIADYGRSGGQGSEDGAGNITLGPGGAGGSAAASTGDTTSAGFSGGSGSFGPGGYGGLSPLGGQPGIGGRTFPDNPAIDGTAAEAPGSGGGAGGADVADFGFGADGANGRVLISWDTTDPAGIPSAEAWGTVTILRAGVPSQAPGATWTKLLMSTAGVYVMYPLGGNIWGWWLPFSINHELFHLGGYRLITGLDRASAAPAATWTKYAMTTAGVDVMYPESGEQTGFLGVHSAFMIGDSAETEGDGIASAEAWGRPFISAVSGIAPSSIDSEEAFGSPSLSAVITVRPSGFSDGAVGTPTVFPGPVTVSPSSIASEEALGSPTILQTHSLRFRIGGRDLTGYLHHETEFSWNRLKGSRGSCSIPLIIEPGDVLAPQVGEFIEIFDPAEDRVWAGTAEQVFVKWFGNAGDHVLIVTGITLESLFDTAEVDKMQFDGVSGASAFSDLFDAVDQDLVTLGDVDGPDTIDGLEVTRVADGFSSIALRCNRIWFVDPADLTVVLIAADDRSAPWIMTEDEILWESAQWRQSRAEFRDTQVIQSPDGTTQTIIALTPNTSIGRRAFRLTLTTSYTSAGAIQEATAALRRFSTLPSQLLVSTDRPGLALGSLLQVDVELPIEAEGILNGFWQITEVEARCLTGMDRVEVEFRRVPADLQLGHFRYTVRLVNALAFAIFQGDGATTVFVLPVAPGLVSSIRVSPNPELYTTGSSGDEVTITPAMPPGTYGTVGYQGEATPDAGTFLDVWKGMSPIASSAGPTSGSGGATAQKFIADATLRDLTIQDDAGPHAIVYAAGTASRVLVVVRQVLGADLVVRINLNGTEIITVTIDSGTAVDDVLEFPMSARAFTVTIASPGVVTLAGASLVDDVAVVVHTTGALPTGLTAETTYYVVNSSGSTFELAATPGGTSIDTSGTQSGNHWLTSDAIAAPAFADKDVLTYDILASDEAIDITPGGFSNLTVEWE